MPCPVRWMKYCAEPPGGDHLPGRRVDRLARRPDRGRDHRPGLGQVEHLVHVGRLGGHLARPDAAGDVGAVPDAVTVEHGAAEVAQDDLAPFDRPVTRVMVGAGGVGPRGHDREVHAGVALVDQPAADVGGDVGLGPPHQRDGSRLELFGDPVRRGAGPSEGLDLVRILHRPQRTRHLARPGGTRPGAGASGGRRGIGPRSGRRWPPTMPARRARRRSRPDPASRPTPPARTRRVAPTTRGASRRGTTSVASRSTGTTSMVRRSSGMAS